MPLSEQCTLLFQRSPRAIKRLCDARARIEVKCGDGVGRLSDFHKFYNVHSYTSYYLFKIKYHHDTSKVQPQNYALLGIYVNEVYRLGFPYTINYTAITFRFNLNKHIRQNGTTSHLNCVKIFIGGQNNSLYDTALVVTCS